MTAPLMEKIVLERTELLGDYSDPQPIGHHYGDLRSSWVRCSKITPQLWLVGAHPWQQVTRCRVGGKETFSFEPRLREDTDGVLRQYVYLSLPPSSDAFTVEVTGLGKVSAVNGKLLENPDEIIEDIASIAGRAFNFPLFREACSEKRLKIAGSVVEDRTVRSYVAEILESCGAVWLGTNAAFHPDTLGAATEILYPNALKEVVSVLDVCGKLDIFYNWNEARGWNGSYMQLEAKGSQFDRTGVIYAKWLRAQRDVERLGRAVLGKRAGRCTQVSATVPGEVLPGTVVLLSGLYFPGPFRVLTAVVAEEETDITGEVLLETYPNIKVSRFTSEASSQRSERVDVAIYENGECEITVFDSQNRPMEGVLVTIDYRVTKKTDERGIVVFVLTKGNHTLTLSGSEIENNDPYPLYIA